MDRRNFIATGAVSTAGMLFFPGNLLASEAKIINKQKLVQPLSYKMDGEWKEFELYIDIHIHEPAPGFKYHTLAFNDMIPGPEIRVNAVAPGGLEFTPKNKKEEIFLQRYSELTPMKRMMQKGELNSLIEYLCSKNSSYITGAVIVIDGGWTVW